MSGKKPDTPVVHLPWSSWQDITARLDAVEAAVFKLGHHALHGLQQRAMTEALPPAAPCADEVAAMVRAVENVYFGGSSAKDEVALVMRAALAALAPLRQAERERAWRDGAEAMRAACLTAARGVSVAEAVALVEAALTPPPGAPDA